MADVPPPNAKVYDRPDRTGPSPLLWVVIALIIIVGGVFVYRWLHHTRPAAAPAQPGVILAQTVSGLELNSYGTISQFSGHW
jgi:hypothetical protein